LLVVVVIWGSSYTLFKVVYREIDPVAYTGAQYGVLVVMALVYLVATRGSARIDRSDLPALALAGATGFFVFQLALVLGLQRSSAQASAILVAAHPLFAVMVVWLLRRSRARPIEIAGIAISVVGVLVFERVWDAVNGLRPGDLLALLAAAAFGVYGVVSGSLAERYPSTRLLAYGLVCGGLPLVVVCIPAMASQDWGRAGGKSWLIVAYGFLGPVLIGNLLWVWAIGRRGVSRTVVYGFLVPVLGVVIAVIGLNERFGGFPQWIGAALVLAGLAVVRLGDWRANEAHSDSTQRGGLDGTDIPHRDDRPEQQHDDGDRDPSHASGPAGDRA
jgi:drug/metabolite transporter (DMT)-like permease